MFSLKKALEESGYNVDVLDLAVVETFRRAIGGLAQGAQNEWIRLAQSRLKTSRTDYINGLRQAESFVVTMVDGEPTYTISLVGDFPNSIEFGMPSFDMKAARPGWLGGGKAKIGKDGKRYVVIPMRHSQSSDSRVGYTGQAAASDMQTQLKAAVKAYGLGSMVKTGGMVATGPVGRIPKNAPVHPYLQGLTRVQGATTGPSGKQRGSAQLMTWRIISENSPASAWIHPGIEARNLLAEVERWVDTQLKNLVDNVMKAAS